MFCFVVDDFKCSKCFVLMKRAAAIENKACCKKEEEPKFGYKTAAEKETETNQKRCTKCKV